MSIVDNETRLLTALFVANQKKWFSQVHGALKKHHGNVAATAKSLKTTRESLWRMIRKMPSVLEGTGHRKNESLRIARGEVDT